MQHATQLEAEADTLEQQASRFTLSPTQQQPSSNSNTKPSRYT
jgi:hypothetical protein